VTIRTGAGGRPVASTTPVCPVRRVAAHRRVARRRLTGQVREDDRV
jgi:hypothetical protein